MSNVTFWCGEVYVFTNKYIFLLIPGGAKATSDFLSVFLPTPPPPTSSRLAINVTQWMRKSFHACFARWFGHGFYWGLSVAFDRALLMSCVERLSAEEEESELIKYFPPCFSRIVRACPSNTRVDCRSREGKENLYLFIFLCLATNYRQEF